MTEHKSFLMQDGIMEVQPDEFQTFPAFLKNQKAFYSIYVPKDLAEFLLKGRKRALMQVALREMRSKETVELFSLLKSRKLSIVVLCPKCGIMGRLLKTSSGLMLKHNSSTCYISKILYPDAHKRFSFLVAKYRRQLSSG